MANSISTFKATPLLWISLAVCLVQSTTIRGRLSDMAVVSDIITYVKPYIQSLHVGPEMIYERQMTPNTSPRTAIEAIEKKIRELQPYLQDNDVVEKVRLEDDETTMIEFTPRGQNNVTNDDIKESFQNNLKKYKKMRNKIKLALEKELVSSQTKHFVTATLDELIATLVQKQCLPGQSHNNDMETLARFRASFLETFFNNSYYNCHINNKKLSEEQCRTALKCFMNHANLYQADCKKLLKELNINQENNDNYNILFCNAGNVTNKLCKNIPINIEPNMTSGYVKDFFKNLLPSHVVNLYDTFTTSVANVLRESDRHPHKYKCTLIETDKTKTGLRSRDCPDFKICSNELRDFLSTFYVSLNDTSVRTFKNYAAMYDRDIIAEESEEKNAAISTISRAGNIVQDRVAKAYVKSTAAFALDQNKDREMNIAHLKEFVKHTVANVKKSVIKHVEADISSLKTRLLLPVKEDLTYNLATDLGHCESDVIKNICSFFLTCKRNQRDLSKSQYLTRKRLTEPKSKSNKVFVNMELALDDDFKKILIKNRQAMLKKEPSNVILLRRHEKEPDDNKTTAVVTETTRPNYEAQPTTLSNKLNKMRMDNVDPDE